jgi:hypothetical protein
MEVWQVVPAPLYETVAIAHCVRDRLDPSNPQDKLAEGAGDLADLGSYSERIIRCLQVFGQRTD